MTAFTPITPPRVAVVDPRTGLISREWYLFFLSLFRATETSVSAEIATPPAESLVASLDAVVSGVEQELQTLPVSVVEQVQPFLDDLAQQIETLPRVDQTVPARFILPSGITPVASPYTYRNTSGYPVDVIVSGGTVTSTAFSRDNTTFYTIGLSNGMFALSPYDSLRVTWATVAPTMTLVPR
jgi:hypothetical protein